MSTEQPEEGSLKRKRTQKSRQGPSTSAKRRKAEDELQDEELDGAAPSSSEKLPNGVSKDTNGSSQGPAVNAEGSQRLTTTTSPGQLDESQKKRQEEAAERNKGWTLSNAAGGIYLHKGSKFSIDGQFLFAAKEHQLRVLSLGDSVVHKTISYSEKSVIRAFTHSRVNPDRVYVGLSNPERIEAWDLDDTTSPANTEAAAGEIVQLAIGRAAQEDEELVYALVKTKGFSSIRCASNIIFKTKTKLQDIVIAGDALVGFGGNKLVVGKLGSKDTSSQLVEWEISNTISCFGVRKYNSTASKKKLGPVTETRLSIALGTTTGEIFIYENVLVAEKASASMLPTPRTLHWHRESVGSVKWSRDGDYLISGGRETTLVIWQLTTGKKQFLPHLSADIEHITVAPSGTSYALQLADNSIMVLSTTELKPTSHFPDLQAQLPSTDALSQIDGARSTSARLSMVGAFHPTNKDQLHIVVPPKMAQSATLNNVSSRPFVQSFDISNGLHLHRQALTRNKVTDSNSGPEGKPVQEPDVYLMQLSFDGTVMATIETWEPPTSDYKFMTHDSQTTREQARQNRETYLKFWRWNEAKACWALQNRITTPHPFAGDAGRVLGLVADPCAMRFFTIGEDSTVRSWTPRQPGRTAPSGDAQEWSSRAQADLPSSDLLSQTQQSSITGTIAVSPDASVLACSIGTSSSASTIHLLNTLPLQPLAVLPPIPGQVHSLSFSARTLCILTTEVLAQYDIPTLRPLASIPLQQPKSSIPLSFRHRPLAVSPSAPSLAALAIPTFRLSDPSTPYSEVDVIDLALTKKQVRYRTVLPGIVTAIFPDPRLRGAFLLIMGDSSVLRLAGPRDTLAGQRAPAVEGPMRTVTQTLATAVVNEDPAPPPEIEQLDGERRVVRPEQLARLFEGAAAGAMPVRAMFEGVMELFAPRAVVA